MGKALLIGAGIILLALLIYSIFKEIRVYKEEGKIEDSRIQDASQVSKYNMIVEKKADNIKEIPLTIPFHIKEDGLHVSIYYCGVNYDVIIKKEIITECGEKYFVTPEVKLKDNNKEIK